jgi:hypothetical protein
MLRLPNQFEGENQSVSAAIAVNECLRRKSITTAIADLVFIVTNQRNKDKRVSKETARRYRINELFIPPS